MLQNNKCRLCDDRDETIYHIISKHGKSEQREYKTRHDMVGNVIYRELCKRMNFDHPAKWYMPQPESVIENETHKLSGVSRNKQITYPGQKTRP